MDTMTKNPMFIEEGVSNISSESKNYDPYDDKYWWTPMGFYRRLKGSRLVAMFSSNDSEVTVKDIDAIINVFALVNALVLTMPISMITTTKYSDWDHLQILVNSCSKYPSELGVRYSASGYYNFVYYSVCNNAMCSIYCTFVGLVLTVLYYLGRPSEQKIDEDAYMKRKSLTMSSPYDTIGEDLINSNFRKWWRRGKALVVIILVTTTIAIITLICAVNVYYQIFFSSTSDFCNAAPQRVKNFWFAFLFLFFLFAIAVYIIL